MASCSKNISSEEIIHLIIEEENETKKVIRIEKESEQNFLQVKM